MKIILYEIAALVLAMTGSILLIIVYFPLLNPVQYQIDNNQATASIGRYLVGTPVALAILWSAWYCNREARRLR